MKGANKMKKWKVEIIGFADDEDRTEYLADCVVCDTKEEALKVKNEMLGVEGIWSECDVYGRIRQAEEE